jgi:hypothetical protein
VRGCIHVQGTWRRATTSFSLYYVGESGSPFTYLAGGTGNRLGDLNADGSNSNDPIHVPRDATNPDEIRFSSPAEQVAFERFIENSSCLRSQRGRILERNSCREPWSHTTIAAVRQTFPVGNRAVEVGIDLSNVLNLLNRSWGHYRVVAVTQLLRHVGHTTDEAGNTQPVFRLCATLACNTPVTDATPEWSTFPTSRSSSFKCQCATASERRGTLALNPRPPFSPPW